MQTRRWAMAAVALLAIAGTEQVHAAVIIQPVAVSSASPLDELSGFFNNFLISQLIDQSGLSATYTSGVTDFDAFTSTTTAGNFAASIGGRRLPFPVNFDFDLGQVYNVDAIALWNQSGTASIRNFNLFADTASDFSTAVNLGSYLAGGGHGSLANIGSGPV